MVIEITDKSLEAIWKHQADGILDLGEESNSVT
jgi:hypothetical protein